MQNARVLYRPGRLVFKAYPEEQEVKEIID